MSKPSTSPLQAARRKKVIVKALAKKTAKLIHFPVSTMPSIRKNEKRRTQSTSHGRVHPKMTGMAIKSEAEHETERDEPTMKNKNEGKRTTTAVQASTGDESKDAET